MANSICQMCGQRSRLIRAHIIPRSFYPEHRRGGGTLSLLSSGPKTDGIALKWGCTTINSFVLHVSGI